MIGTFKLSNGDMYIGEVVSISKPQGEKNWRLVVLQNYAVWYEGDSEPFNSALNDTVQFAVDNEDTMELESEKQSHG